MDRIGLVRDPRFLEHDNGPGHPESAARLRAIDRMLERFPLADQLVAVPARDATPEEMGWVHGDAYLRKLELTRGVPYTSLDPDTSTNERSFAAAIRAAGGVIAALEAAAAGGLAGTFALVRPPGHHAESDRAMGFCLLNNIAIAAEYALRRMGMSRVLIVDWDVHHGNGTMHSFYDSNRVLFFSAHQYPHYPGTGRVDEIGSGPGLGYSVNVPLPAGQGDRDYAAIFDQLLIPLAREFRPEAILVSAGFDLCSGDPLAGMEVSVGGIALMTRRLVELSAATCPGRLVFTLEGGYQPESLTEGISTVLQTLAGGPPPGDPSPTGEGTSGGPGDATLAVIDVVRKLLAPYWSSLRRGP